MTTILVNLPDDLEQLLLEGVLSGPVESWTDEEWQAIKHRVLESDDQRSS
ncbi:MAG: hypothetical protein HUJ26_15415 [Planctomycetaceae bacterium]|nr:hypothetical protein [Planctomycetaceae bacterium]